MEGEYIPRAEEGKGEPPYAQILAVYIAASSSAAYDVVLRLRLRVLRTLMKRDNVDLVVQASLGYDNVRQLLYVTKFNLDSRTESGFYNAGLEMLANNVGYSQILKKTRFDLREIISKELKKANGLLENGLELKGLVLKGAVEEALVQDIVPQADGISLVFLLQGNVEAEIYDLLSLMPPK